MNKLSLIKWKLPDILMLTDSLAFNKVNDHHRDPSTIIGRNMTFSYLFLSHVKYIKVVKMNKLSVTETARHTYID